MEANLIRRGLRLAAAAGIPCLATPALAQTSTAPVPSVVVEGSLSTAEQRQLPVTSESITAARMADTVNAMTVEDALKYLPSVMIRRRYIGDTQAPMATRTTGINASARSLVYVDGVPLSALINNNNQNGSPQWFMVSPDEISRVDVLYGPFAAAYPGNSYGAVTEIVTRMPKRFEGSAKIGLASQDFSQYGTSDHYPSTQASLSLGNRSGALSWWASFNHLSSFSQPVTYLTATQSPTTTVPGGAWLDRNRTGAPILVLGAGNLTHTVQDAAKVKVAYDMSPSLSANYMLGYWKNNASASSQSYLTMDASAPMFLSNANEQEHWMQGLTLKTRNEGPWNWAAVLTHFNYGKDITRTSTASSPSAASPGTGRILDAGGTNWTTVDLKATWDQPGSSARHNVSFGVHHDLYQLSSPTYNTNDWLHGARGAVFSDSRGRTRTQAVWAQDVWQLNPAVVATLGARYEWWRAYDGFNFATSSSGAGFPVTQPEVGHTGISPKASIAWRAERDWRIMASFGKALRFPTVGELYQNIQTGQTFTQANPFLKPERVLSAELAAERKTSDNKLRVSLFEEHVADALISQTSTVPGVAVPVSFVQNVDKTRQRGIELVGNQDNAFIKGLELGGSLTYVNARITANGSYVPTVPGASSVGKRTPYVPKWRATATASYRPNASLVYTLAARYSTRMYATVDNTDINPATYQGFDSYLVIDARIRYLIDRHWSLAAGVDNLNNRNYFLFHPFPQRTLSAELKYEF